MWLLWTERAVAPTIPAPQQSATSTKSTESAPHTKPAAPSSAPLDTLVTVDNPKANATVSHNFTIQGSAPGPWYFEAVFPIQVRDGNDNVIGRTQGKAQGEWMTNDLVKFTAQMFVDTSYHGPASLILLRDNPSGLPEYDDSVTIPITIK